MKRTNGRRVMFTLLLALGPFAMACEAVLDFDRTPLQEELEGGTDGGSSRDGSTEGGSRRPDPNPSRDSGQQQPVDAGSDAEAGT